jgi:hypothetical protein
MVTVKTLGLSRLCPQLAYRCNHAHRVTPPPTPPRRIAERCFASSGEGGRASSRNPLRPDVVLYPLVPRHHFPHPLVNRGSADFFDDLALAVTHHILHAVDALPFAKRCFGFNARRIA